MDSIYEHPAGAADSPQHTTIEFGTRDPLEVLSAATVYVEYTTDRPGRHPVTYGVPGYTGQWICAYSSLARLRAARIDDVEYSQLRGVDLLAIRADHIGVWLDRGFPDGRPIVLPMPEPPADNA